MRAQQHKDSYADGASHFISSWSGGKDSALALYRALKAGGTVGRLITMMTEQGQRSRSHGLALGLLQAQARCMDIPLHTAATSWADYETTFIRALKEARKSGIKHAVFGDIDIEQHRQWEEGVCEAAEIQAHLPLWNEDRRALLDQFLQAGFQAMIIAAKDEPGGKEMLGKFLSESVIDELEALGWDACGENGEYHTVVCEGPLFTRPLKLVPKEKVLREGYWFLDLGTFDA